MQYNECGKCKAGNGRCGNCFREKGSSLLECLNCHDTRKSGDIVIHANLPRTDEELSRTFAIIEATELTKEG